MPRVSDLKPVEPVEPVVGVVSRKVPLKGVGSSLVAMVGRELRSGQVGSGIVVLVAQWGKRSLLVGPGVVPVEVLVPVPVWVVLGVELGRRVVGV